MKSGTPAYRYLGTVRTSGAGVTCDTLLKRFVWNFYHRSFRTMFARDTTASWSYATATWRIINAAAANKIQFVIGVSEDLVEASHEIYPGVASGESYLAGIGLDAENALAANAISAGTYLSGGTWIRQSIISLYSGCPGIGYHYLAAIENAAVGTISVYANIMQGLYGGIFS